MLNKIGIISTFPPTQCGIATYTSDLIEGLKQQYPFLNIQQFELNNNHPDNSSRFIIRNDNPDDYLKASEFINSSDIDIIDIQHEFKIFGKPDGENINILLNNIKKPIVSTLHTVNFNLPEYRESVFNNLLLRSDSIFLFSDKAKNYIVEKYKVSSSKIVVIPHGTPKISFRIPNEIYLKKQYYKDLVFVSSGHMRETKGYDVAIQALNKLKSEITNFHYFIIGADHPQNETAQKYRKKLVELVNDSGLKDKVTFVDKYLSLKKLISYIQLADICLLPYTREQQSSSGVLALMVACGRPIVSTPFQFACSQMTRNSGIVTKSFLPDDFADGIKTLIAGKNIWDEIMYHNFTLGLSWNWCNVARHYYSGYRRILKEQNINNQISIL